MSFALLFSAFGYGLRHGFDWDHIAALTDISSVEKSKKRAFLLSSFYALGHAAVVMILGWRSFLLISLCPRVWIRRSCISLDSHLSLLEFGF